MKFRLSFKTPDVVFYAVKGESEENKDAIERCLEKYVEYGECVSIEFDTDDPSYAVVIPVSRR